MGQHILDCLFDALVRGNIDVAMACLAPDATLWHNFDDRYCMREEIRQQWQNLVARTTVRGISDVRRQQTPEGCVQQHRFFISSEGGISQGWDCCVVVRLENGLILRMEEYLAPQSPLARPGAIDNQADGKR